jgi:hypothetical protein
MTHLLARSLGALPDEDDRRPRQVETLTIDLFEPDDRSRDNRLIHAATIFAVAIERSRLTDADLRRAFEDCLRYRNDGMIRELTAAQTAGW